jgi:hypothetical protein
MTEERSGVGDVPGAAGPGPSDILPVPCGSLGVLMPRPACIALACLTLTASSARPLRAASAPSRPLVSRPVLSNGVRVVEEPRGARGDLGRPTVVVLEPRS